MIVIELAQAMLDLSARIDLAGQCEYVQVTARYLRQFELVHDDVTPEDAPKTIRGTGKGTPEKRTYRRMGDRSKLAQAIGRENIGLCHAVLKACEGETLPADAAHNLRGAVHLLAPKLLPQAETVTAQSVADLTLANNGPLTAKQIADELGKPDKAEAIRQKLNRLMNKNKLPLGAFVEVADPPKGSPRYLFHLDKVRGLLAR